MVELQTNFGGGKTHSMLALYHLFGGQLKPQDVPGLETLVPARLKGGRWTFPSPAGRCGSTQLSPVEVRKKADGCEIHTLWGEMAWQIGSAAGNAGEAYAMLAEEDRRASAPAPKN